MSKKVKEPKAGKAPKGKKGDGAAKPGKVKKTKVKGALLGRVTNHVAVLFALSLAVEKVASTAG